MNIKHEINNLKRKLDELYDNMGKKTIQEVPEVVDIPIVKKIDSKLDNIKTYDDEYIYEANYKFDKSFNCIIEYIKDKNIVILGNAKSILNNPKNIDDYDIVIRLNTALPSEEYKDYIGTRTDIWFFLTAEKLHFEKYINEFNPKFMIGRIDYGRRVGDFEFIEYPVELRNNINEYTYKDEYYYEGIEDYKPNIKRPTTGMTCIDLFIKLGGYKSLTLYGFDSYRTNNWTSDYAMDEKTHSSIVEHKWFDTLYDNRHQFNIEMPEYERN